MAVDVVQSGEAIEQLLEAVARDEALRESWAVAEGARPVARLEGTWGSHVAACVEALRRRSRGPIFVLCPTPAHAEGLWRDLELLAGADPDDLFQPRPWSDRFDRHDVIDAPPPPHHTWALLPDLDQLPYEVLRPDCARVGRRLDALTRLTRGEALHLVSSVDALLRRVPPPEALAEATLDLEVGQRLERSVLVARLVQMGYRRVELVLEPGDVALRGAVVDIFPSHLETPARLEFFDDELDTLRLFDAETQRSIVHLLQLRLVPAREVFYVPSRLAAIRRNLLRLARHARRPPEAVDEMLERVEALRFYPGIERHLPQILDGGDAPLDLFPAGGTLVLVDRDRIDRRVTELDEAIQREYEASCAEGELVPAPDHLYVAPSAWHAEIEGRRRIETVLFAGDGQEGAPPAKRADVRTLPSYRGHLDQLAKVLVEKPGRALILVRTAEELALLRDRLAQAESTSTAEGVTLAQLPLANGFELAGVGLKVLTEFELFGEHEPAPARARPASDLLYDQLRELRPGDLAVHVDHGVGRYEGLVEQEIDGVREDFVLLRYAGNDKLYVPVDRLQLIQRFRAAEEARGHALDRLGAGTWARTKERVRRDLLAAARDLVELAARRATRRGFAFPPDDPWQREFEAAFPFPETPDQLAAIAATKADMEREAPMDRLICGDAGFGKTEVALRAAFKATRAGKQVALICPTTILAQQHYETFVKRFASFPGTIAPLSRFQSRDEIKDTLKGLREGRVDIVIGTHRLLHKDVAFRDLGLLIVDEEQRFGVSHKEKLKRFRASVDVLTLTATPIPRTLHMALLGLRDISVIKTPPRDRVPIHTRVVPFSPEFVRDSILREMERGGQVFFVHNRVNSIDSMRIYLERLVPEARIVVAHGQMRPGDLEEAMLGFYRRRYDVLLCTTIIESGLDIPMANTILINRAEQFGLAQLYQLRGRVGRERQAAYAYLCVPDRDTLTEVARRRLAAIEAHTDAGSGLRIASRDLEIRGGGNLLGTQQSGHIDAVGYDLYLQLVQEALAELQGEDESAPPEEEVVVKVKQSALIPASYIPDMAARLHVYRSLARAGGQKHLDRVIEDVADRFGPVPVELERLVDVFKIKHLVRGLGVARIDIDARGARLRFSEPGRPALFVEADPSLPSTSLAARCYQPILDALAPRTTALSGQRHAS